MKRTGKLLESALHLLEALRPPRALIGNEVTRQECPEGFSGLGSACVLVGGWIAAKPHLREQALGLGASGADVEQRGRAQRHAPAFATEVVLHDPVTRAALAQAQPEAAKLVVPKSLVLRARLRASVLMAVVVSFTGEPLAWAGHGQDRPAFPCHLLLSLHSRYGKPA